MVSAPDLGSQILVRWPQVLRNGCASTDFFSQSFDSVFESSAELTLGKKMSAMEAPSRRAMRPRNRQSNLHIIQAGGGGRRGTPRAHPAASPDDRPRIVQR